LVLKISTLFFPVLPDSLDFRFHPLLFQEQLLLKVLEVPNKPFFVPILFLKPLLILQVLLGEPLLKLVKQVLFVLGGLLSLEECLLYLVRKLYFKVSNDLFVFVYLV
jgi:hypothetical protein